MKKLPPLIVFVLGMSIPLIPQYGCVFGATASSGAWTFKTPESQNQGKALLNLRSLNEKVAGEHGFIRVSKSGYGFVRGDGKPIRFWGVTSFAGDLKGFKATENAARFLARYGVNMVRFHGESDSTNQLWPKQA